MWVVPVIIGVTLFLAQTAPFPFLLDWIHRDVALWRMPPSGTTPSASPVVYLTFDDGPNPTATGAVLDALARYDARATFFVIPRHVTAETAHIVRRAADAGHGIALHAHDRRLANLPAAAVADILDADEARVEAITGVDVCPAFRPHGGTRSFGMLHGVRRTGRRLIGWGLLLWDWDWFRRPRADRVARRLLGRVSDGAIIVLHDGHHEDPRADRRRAVALVDLIVPALQARGYRFGSVCDAVAALDDRPGR